MTLDSRSSRMSSRVPRTPALKKTLVVPSLYSLGSIWRADRILSVTTLPSTKPCGIALGARIEYLQWKVRKHFGFFVLC